MEPHTGRAFAVSVIGLVVLPVAVVGLVLSIIAFERAKRLGAATGLAVAGIVCGCVGCLAVLPTYVVATRDPRNRGQAADASMRSVMIVAGQEVLQVFRPFG